MEGNKHLTYFKVENFKCFDTFEMDDIGQFNLIVGDNNVGKTSVLEALLLDRHLNNALRFLIQAFSYRFNIVRPNLLLDDSNHLSFYTNKRKHDVLIKFQFSKDSNDGIYTLGHSIISKLTDDGRKKLREIASASTAIHAAFLSNGNDVDVQYMIYGLLTGGANPYLPFIPFNLGYGFDLIAFFSEKIQLSAELESQFIKELDSFINGIQEIRISTSDIKDINILKIRLKDIDELIPLAMFGEGANKLFRILAEMVVNANGKLLIDEVDTGIHYSRFKQYWKTILVSAKRNNVQLFMTTHSQECLKYFKEALEELLQEFPNDNYTDKARHFLLKKNKIGNVIAKKFSFEQFQFALDNGNEIRD